MGRKPAAGVNTQSPTPPPATNPAPIPVNVPDVRDNSPFSNYIQANPMELSALNYGPNGAISGHSYINPGKQVSSLYRGYMKEATTERDGGPFRLYFCFNPTQLDFGYNLDPGQAGFNLIDRSPDMLGHALGVGKSISFGLIFDRTYEVWQGDPPNGKPGPGTYGALWDARAAERLVGIYDAHPEGPPQPAYPIQVTFSRTNAGLGADLTPAVDLSPINFIGWIQSMGITFSRFDMNMVPTRCEISFTFQITLSTADSATQPPPDTSLANGASGDAPVPTVTVVSGGGRVS